jgi:hypothetical protein
VALKVLRRMVGAVLASISRKLESGTGVGVVARGVRGVSGLRGDSGRAEGAEGSTMVSASGATTVGVAVWVEGGGHDAARGEGDGEGVVVVVVVLEDEALEWDSRRDAE